MIAAGALLLLLAADQPTAPAAERSAVKPNASAEPKRDLTPEQQSAASLAKVRRIYVDILTGGESALRIRDLLMSSIQASKLFIITEQEDKADAVLKGAGRDEVFTDVFQSSEGVNAHSQFSFPTANNSNSSRYSDRTSGSMGVGENDNRKTEERKHEAIATVRLVNNDGDVIWSATEESLGAKFMGASVDVVTKITKKLAEDYRRAKAAAAP